MLPVFGPRGPPWWITAISLNLFQCWFLSAGVIYDLILCIFLIKKKKKNLKEKKPLMNQFDFFVAARKI